MKPSIILIALSFFLGTAFADYPYELLYEWNFLNFTFQTTEQYQSYIKNKQYENCMLAGVKVSMDGEIFVSIPRWKNANGGVPATLNKIVVTEENVTLLEPYPSWEMNQIGNPDALQSVLGFEVDPQNRLWVLDQGKVGPNPAIPGSIKLLIFDLNTDKLIQSYYFSELEAPLNNSFMNDLVIDKYNGFAYITDTGLGADVVHAGLVVYDFNKNIARRVLNQVTSVQPDPSVWVEVNGEHVVHDAPFQAGADGIALSPDAQTLFWCPLSSRNLFGIDTALLRDFLIPESIIEENVRWIMDKKSASDGLGASNEKDGIVYATAIELNGILKLHVNSSDVVELVTFDNDQMQWPDTMGFDHQGWLLFVSNKLQRIWRIFINAGSYLDPPTSYLSI